jgi:hypothetical protein
MKKSALPAALLLFAASLSGCPIYDHDQRGCYRDSDCAAGYSCDTESGSCASEPESAACRRPSDCETNETCSRSATCMVGDCHFESVGCVRGYVCASVDDRWACVDEDALGQGGAASGAAGEAAAAGGAGSATAGAASGGEAGSS